MKLVCVAAVLLALSSCRTPDQSTALSMKDEVARAMADCAPLCPDGQKATQVQRVYDRVRSVALLNCGCSRPGELAPGESGNGASASAEGVKTEFY